MFSYEGSGVRAALEGKRKGDPILLFNNEIFIKVLQTPAPRKGKEQQRFPTGRGGRLGWGCIEGVVVVGGGSGEGTPDHHASHCTPMPRSFLEGLMQGVLLHPQLCRNGPFHPCNRRHMTVIEANQRRNTHSSVFTFRCGDVSAIKALSN